MRPAILASSVSAPCANAASTAATSAAASLPTLVLTNPWPGISCPGSRLSACKAKYYNCNSVNHTYLIFRSVKAATEAWIAVEDESEEEEIDGEEEEKEEETDVETDGEAVEEVFELF